MDVLATQTFYQSAATWLCSARLRSHERSYTGQVITGTDTRTASIRAR